MADPTDTELEQFSEFMANVYRPPSIIEYDVDEKVVGLGVSETMNYLESLLDSIYPLFNKLKDDQGFQKYFLDGQDLDDESYFQDPRSREIEVCLQNHFRVAAKQIARAMFLLPKLKASTNKKQEIVKDIFQEYENAVDYVVAWRTEEMEELLNTDCIEYSELARELGSEYGVIFDDEHREGMMEEMKNFDPTKPSYQNDEKVMNIYICKPMMSSPDESSSEEEEDSKPSAAAAAAAAAAEQPMK